MQFEEVLEATGFIHGGKADEKVHLLTEAEKSDELQRHGFAPDAVWEGHPETKVLFKRVETPPDLGTVSAWRKSVWNRGFAPLLWVVSPQRIDIYNCFARPTGEVDAVEHLIRSFEAIDERLKELDEFAGRVSMESGQFWVRQSAITQEGRVDYQLLSDLKDLDRQLTENLGLPRRLVHVLIGRFIFIQYLVDRGILSAERLLEVTAYPTIAAAVRDKAAVDKLFLWLRTTFNGDMFPAVSGELEEVRQEHLTAIADTLSGAGGGQYKLWPYKFDVIPVEFISSIYEQFAHTSAGDQSRKDSLHYTPVSLVHLVLDEVLSDIKHSARILDLTCGSGVFLVESFRRLVRLRGGDAPSREIIRSVLHGQLFGIDKHEAAVRVAAFSLYLAALELDPDPFPPEALKFRPLINHTLFVDDALDFEKDSTRTVMAGQIFDAIVGNPPWTYTGKEVKRQRRAEKRSKHDLPRGEDFRFVERSLAFSDANTRFGLVVNGRHFFAKAAATVNARRWLFENLKPLTLVNLAPLRESLFPTAETPAMVLLARCRPQPDDQVTLVNVNWSAGYERAGVLEIAPDDIKALPMSKVVGAPEYLKLAACGGPRDAMLLDRLSRLPTLSDILSDHGSALRQGFQYGGGDQRSTKDLAGLPMLRTGQFTRFHIDASNLPSFDLPFAHRPREREIYQGPVIIVAEGGLSEQARCPAAWSDNTVAFERNYYGASLAGSGAWLAPVLTAILNSALATWFFLMTSSEFGVFKRRLLLLDYPTLPIPNFSAVPETAIQNILDIEKRLRQTASGAGDAIPFDRAVLTELDNAVFELYGLRAWEKTVAKEGLDRARREFVSPRWDAEMPASTSDVATYAEQFAAAIEVWLAATGKRSIRSEVFDLGLNAPLRVVRFTVGDVAQSDETRRVRYANGRLKEVLENIASRMNVPLGPYLRAGRTIRAYVGDEVFIIKPASRRYWSAGIALQDADYVLAEDVSGGIA